MTLATDPPIAVRGTSGDDDFDVRMKVGNRSFLGLGGDDMIASQDLETTGDLLHGGAGDEMFYNVQSIDGSPITCSNASGDGDIVRPGAGNDLAVTALGTVSAFDGPRFQFCEVSIAGGSGIDRLFLTLSGGVRDPEGAAVDFRPGSGAARRWAT